MVSGADETSAHGCHRVEQTTCPYHPPAEHYSTILLITRPHRNHPTSALVYDAADGQTAGYDLPPPSRAGLVPTSGARRSLSGCMYLDGEYSGSRGCDLFLQFCPASKRGELLSRRAVRMMLDGLQGPEQPGFTR